MSDLPLPNGWTSVPLKEVCHQISDGTHKTPNYQDSGVRFISIKNIRPFQPIDWDSYVRFVSEAEHKELCKRCRPEPDDILFPRIGTLGFAKRIDFPEPVSIFVGLGILKPNKALVRPKYLEYYMNTPSIAQMSRDCANGSGRMTLPLEESREFPFYLAPLNEQDRIVAEIEKQFTRLDDAVAALQHVQANLKRYRASVLKAACEGRLVPIEAELARKEGRDYEPASELLQRILAERRAKWKADQLQKTGTAGTDRESRKTYEDPTAPDISNLSELPEGWTWTSVEQAVQIIDYRGRTPPYSENGIPHLRSSNVRNGQIVWEGLTYVTEEVYQRYMTRGIPHIGDLLFTTEAPLGEVAPVPEAPRFSLAQRLMILRPATGLLRDFLKYQIMSPSFQSRIRLIGTGSTVTGVSSRNFQPLPLCLPPWAEQRRIVAELDSTLSTIQDVESETARLLARAVVLRRSVLREAFLGKLVPQDPNDEPASVLLERIRAERAHAQEQRQKAPKATNGASPANGQRRRREKTQTAGAAHR